MADFIFFLHADFCKGLVESLRHKNGVPSKGIITLRGHNGAIAFANEKNWLFAFAFTICECALGVSSLILKAMQHFMKSLSPNICQEIFNIRAWESIQSIEAEGDVFDHNSGVAVRGCFDSLC
mgnify:CR=1 FL=1